MASYGVLLVSPALLRLAAYRSFARGSSALVTTGVNPCVGSATTGLVFDAWWIGLDVDAAQLTNRNSPGTDEYARSFMFLSPSR